MSNYQDEDDGDDVEAAPIQIDLYGIKATGRPSTDGNQPKTWMEVAKRLNQHLMTIAERAVGVVAETLIAAGNFVRGIGKIPGA